MGQPFRGPRKATLVRLPLQHHAHYKAAAEKLGLDLGSYVAMQLALQHGLEMPAENPARAVLDQLSIDEARAA